MFYADGLYYKGDGGRILLGLTGARKPSRLGEWSPLSSSRTPKYRLYTYKKT
jgi:hypothetical protein